MSMSGEIACTYACLILHDDGIAITADKITAILKAANVSVESYWPSLFAKFCQKRDIGELIMNFGVSGGGAAPVAAATSIADSGVATAPAAVEEKKKEEVKEESDDDEPLFSLFD